MRTRCFLWAGALVVLGSLLTAVTQVRPGERLVIRRFGRVLEARPGPGLWIGLPWGLDQVDRVQVDLVRRVAVGFDPAADEDETATPSGQLLTGDHNLVNVRAVIEYSVIEDEAAQYVVQKEQVDELIARAAETILAEWVASHPIDDVLLNGKAEIPPRLVPAAVDGSVGDRGLQGRLKGYDLGVQIRDASVTLLQPPRQVRADFDRVNEAQTGIETERYRAQQDRSQWLGEAEMARDRLLKETQAFAGEQRRLAQTDAANFTKRLNEYRRFGTKNPDYLHDIWLNEMKKVYARMRASGGRIEPLDKLMGRDGIDIITGPIRGEKK